MSALDAFDTSYTNAPVALHIFAVPAIIITGIIGNGLIIYIQIRKPTLKEVDIYILALAFVDLLVCLVICPQYPFLNKYIVESKKGNSFALVELLTCMSLLIWIYPALLTAIALNRFHAVFRPYTYVSSTKRSKLIVAAIIIISFSETVVASLLLNYMPNRYTLGTEFRLTLTWMCLCLFLTSISYLMIVIRLYQHKRKIFNRTASNTEKDGTQLAGPSTSDQRTGISGDDKENETSKHTFTSRDVFPLNVKDISRELESPPKCIWKRATGGVNTAKETNAIHRKTLKMFFFTTVLFIVSNFPWVLIISDQTDNIYITYFTFINNNANIVVYSCFNADFRKEIVGIWKNLKSLAFG